MPDVAERVRPVGDIAPDVTADSPPGKQRAGKMVRGLLRPPRRDDLGLRGALADRVLLILVAAMVFIGALSLGGFVAATVFEQHWQFGAEATLTVQVPQPQALAPPTLQPNARADLTTPIPSSKRIDRALAVLRDTPGIASAHVLSADELASLLRPWLGTNLAGMALPMPAVIDVRLGEPVPETSSLAARLDAAAPGTLTESHGSWVGRLTVLTHSLRSCMALVLCVVALIAMAVISVATRSGLGTRREAIEIVHGLGACDGFIAGPFAWRAMTLAGLGGVLGVVCAVPILAGLAALAAPLVGQPELALSNLTQAELSWVSALPSSLLGGLPALPAAAAAIGWLTAQATVRRWLQQLP